MCNLGLDFGVSSGSLLDGLTFSLQNYKGYKSYYVSKLSNV